MVRFDTSCCWQARVEPTAEQIKAREASEERPRARVGRKSMEARLAAEAGMALSAREEVEDADELAC